MAPARSCLCIDLRSFYASVEAVDRGLDPMRARLVVADPSRSANTICLAVSPALKAQGVRNRCRMGEVPPDPTIIVAKPRMARYLEVSCKVVACLLKWVDATDLHVYSVDESFVELGPYLSCYGATPRAMAAMLQEDVAKTLGLAATCGVGPNLFQAKVALDVLAKHDPQGIAELDYQTFYERIWFHRPITDIWHVGPGTARRLARSGIFDLAGVAAAGPAAMEALLGPARARLLSDHAWGLEPVSMAQVRGWRPRGHTLSRGQVLMRDYTVDECATVVREMADGLALDLAGQGLATGRVSVHVGYSKDRWPPTAGSCAVSPPDNGAKGLADGAVAAFKATAHLGALARRVHVVFSDLSLASGQPVLFDPNGADQGRHRLDGARRMVRGRFGQGSVLVASSLLPEGTARDLAQRIGGHHA